MWTDVCSMTILACYVLSVWWLGCGSMVKKLPSYCMLVMILWLECGVLASSLLSAACVGTATCVLLVHAVYTSHAQVVGISILRFLGAGVRTRHAQGVCQFHGLGDFTHIHHLCLDVLGVLLLYSSRYIQLAHPIPRLFASSTVWGMMHPPVHMPPKIHTWCVLCQ